MVRAGLKLLLALAAALSAATIIALAAGFPTRMLQSGELWPAFASRKAAAVAAAALPGALLVIALSEARRIRGLLFWVVAAALVALGSCHFAAPFGGLGVVRATVTALAMGGAAGWIYWRLAGRRAGQFAAALARYRTGGDESW